jgi:hypothetical protein
MASIARALLRIKEDLAPFLPEESVWTACVQAGHKWRQRNLGPVQTLHLFVLQVLCFNTAMTHLRHLAGEAAKAPGVLPGADAPACRWRPYRPCCVSLRR